MKMIRIAIIDPIGIMAGLDHYDLSLATALINRSCKVKVYSNFNDINNKSIVKNHFKFIVRKGWIGSFRFFKEYLSALKISKADKTEIVIIHLFQSSFFDYLFVRFAKHLHLRVCLIIHDVESLIHLNRKSWIRKCVIFASCIVVHNTIAYDELIKRINLIDKNKVFIIPHGNFLGLQVKTERFETAQYFNLDKNKNYLLFFGMIKSSKGLEVLIEAIKDIPTNVDLIIAGRTRDISFTHYEKLIKKFNLSQRIHPIIQYITNAERNQLFNFADLAILPYRRIYQSGVMLLAMSYGIPVIASDLPANKLLIDGNNGTLFTVDNPLDLAAKINILMADKMKRNSISDCAKDYVAINNNWNKIGEEFVKMFS